MEHLARGRAHAKKSHLCTKQFRRTYSWARVREKERSCTLCASPALPLALRDHHLRTASLGSMLCLGH
jgi:hypothetical protein